MEHPQLPATTPRLASRSMSALRRLRPERRKLCRNLFVFGFAGLLLCLVTPVPLAFDIPPGCHAHEGPLKAGSGNIICPPGEDLPIAGLFRRFKGILIDAFLPMVIVGAAGMTGKPMVMSIAGGGVPVCWLLFLIFTGNTIGKDYMDVRMCWVREGDGSKLVSGVGIPGLILSHCFVTPIVSTLTGTINLLWVFIDPNSQTLADKVMGIYVLHDSVVGGGRF